MNVWFKTKDSHLQVWQDSGAVNIQAFGNSWAMAVTMEMWQHCLVEMHKMNAENIATVMKQQNDALPKLVGSAHGTSALTDIRGIGRPVVFDGDKGKYTERKAKLMAFLRISMPKSDEMI